MRVPSLNHPTWQQSLKQTERFQPPPSLGTVTTPAPDVCWASVAEASLQCGLALAQVLSPKHEQVINYLGAGLALGRFARKGARAYAQPDRGNLTDAALALGNLAVDAFELGGTQAGVARLALEIADQTNQGVTTDPVSSAIRSSGIESLGLPSDSVATLIRAMGQLDSPTKVPSYGLAATSFTGTLPSVGYAPLPATSFTDTLQSLGHARLAATSFNGKPQATAQRQVDVPSRDNADQQGNPPALTNTPGQRLPSFTSTLQSLGHARLAVKHNTVQP